jgi:hypothetical protein
MIRPSLDAPTVYVAVDLDTALDSAVKKHESEPREMQVRKLELQQLAQEQFRLSDEVLRSRSSKVLTNSSLPVYPFLIRCKRNALRPYLDWERSLPHCLASTMPPQHAFSAEAK